jgi:hypothetical protein
MKIRVFWAKCIDLVPAIYIFLSGGNPNLTTSGGPLLKQNVMSIYNVFSTLPHPLRQTARPHT